MSVNGPQSGIRFTGLSSGLDIENIISALIRAESVSVQRLQAQQAQLSARQTIYDQFRGKLNGLNAATAALGFANAYTTTKATNSDTAIGTVSTTDAASVGTYNITVNQLAKNHKVSSTAQTNTTDALALSGSFIVNGKSVTVEAEDTLSNIASKINSANAGVTASIIDGGTNQAYLVMTANTAGVDAKIQLSNASGTALSSLGFLNGTAAVREAPDANTVLSTAQSSNTETLETLLGITGTKSFVIDGNVINIDPSTDSLQTIADQINLAGGPSTATVETVQENGTTKYELKITGAGIPGSITDTDGLLEAVGVFQQGYNSQLSAAQDASITVDGITVTNNSNSFTTVLPGVTFNAIKAGTTEITVSRDNTAIKDKVKGMQKAFNDVIDYIRTNSSFDSETFQSGALFGDQVANQVESTLNQLLFSDLGTGSFKNLADLGFTLDDQGQLEVDESKLDAAIANDLTSVKNLLMATASSTNSQIKYVSSSNKTLASLSGGYQVDITQTATKSTVNGIMAPVLPMAGGEILTFDGALFGGNAIDLNVTSGQTLSQVVDQINSDSRLKDLIVASIDGSGQLQFESKRYGTNGRFTVVSNQAASINNTGIDTTGGTTVDGLDVAGTINGEPATGNGQFLLGDSGNDTTDGLQIQYTGSTTGLVGNIVFNRGVASLVGYRLESFTDTVNGLLSATNTSLKDQIDYLGTRITDIQTNLQLRENTLRLKFAAMEETIARLQSQQGQLSAVFGSGG
ncbi:MAG: flagellar filament capping protein FliD [Fimbriimonadaceae bacterium]